MKAKIQEGWLVLSPRATQSKWAVTTLQTNYDLVLEEIRKGHDGGR